MNKQEGKSLENNQKRQKITIGSVFEVPINGEYYVYGQILPNGGYVFFDYKSKMPIRNISTLTSAPILFVVGVYDYVITRNIWHKVGKLPIRKELETQPMQYIYDSKTGKFSLYDNNTGTITPSSKDAVRGLECAAVWGENHIIDRIRDYYNHIPCIWLKEHYELFPESIPHTDFSTGKWGQLP